MTDENKQALEAVKQADYLTDGRTMEIDIIHSKPIQAALQPKPSVDLEEIYKLIPTFLNDFSHLSAETMLINFIDHLRSQGHLNQGWRDIENLTPEQFTRIIDDFEMMQNVVGYPALTKKDEVILGHFISHLVENKMFRTKPPKSEGE